jgi:Holliday junction resolvase RusA-like endonuclease
MRALLDGLTRGGLISDDRHVTELRAFKRWAPDLGEEGATVRVAEAERP